MELVRRPFNDPSRFLSQFASCDVSPREAIKVYEAASHMCEIPAGVDETQDKVELVFIIPRMHDFFLQIVHLNQACTLAMT